MSNRISELIAQIEQEDRLRHDEFKKRNEEQHQKYEKMIKRINFVKDESLKCQENIVNNLKLLVENKHTIEKHALEQTEEISGLPIPYSEHKSIIDLFSNVTGFINNAETFVTPDTFSPDEICKAAISVAESAASDLKEYSSEVGQAHDLLNHAKLMKSLIDQFTDEPEKFENTSLDTILED